MAHPRRACATTRPSVVAPIVSSPPCARSCGAGSARPSAPPSWPSSTARGTDWCLQVALDVAPALDSDPQSLADAAFWLYLRGASDFAGGRRLALD